MQAPRTIPYCIGRRWLAAVHAAIVAAECLLKQRRLLARGTLGACIRRPHTSFPHCCMPLSGSCAVHATDRRPCSGLCVREGSRRRLRAWFPSAADCLPASLALRSLQTAVLALLCCSSAQRCLRNHQLHAPSDHCVPQQRLQLSSGGRKGRRAARCCRWAGAASGANHEGSRVACCLSAQHSLRMRHDWLLSHFYAVRLPFCRHLFPLRMQN